MTHTVLKQHSKMIARNFLLCLCRAIKVNCEKNYIDFFFRQKQQNVIKSKTNYLVNFCRNVDLEKFVLRKENLHIAMS